jgi:hypothetical protein
MTITVHEDIANGASFSLTPNGPRATRVFIAEINDAETMLEILQDPAIPTYNSVYPGTGPGNYFSQYLYASEISCAPAETDPGVYVVTVNYAFESGGEELQSDDPDACVIQVGSSLTSSKTSFDNSDAKLTVTLTGQPAQLGEVDIQVPETVIMFERKEGASPLSKSRLNSGKVNSTALGVYGARTLLCLGIDGTSTDGGTSWVVTYRFQYRPETWDATVVYIDPETDRPHPDINLGTLDGVIVVQVYETADFDTLDLPW